MHYCNASMMKIQFYLLFICTLAIKVIWCDTEAKMKILGSLTATGTMKNFAEDTSKTVKLATEIKNMLNGMCGYSKGQNIYEKIDGKVQNILTDMKVIKEKLEKIQNLVSDNKCNVSPPKECKDITNKVVGLQTVYPDGNKKLSVQCEEGGWTVIQKRFDGSVEFTRNWNDYENGFGSINGEFWLGNKNIAQLTSGGSHELRIDLEDWDGNKRYAVFKNFTIGDASTKYRLNINGYSGNAGDGMSLYNGMKFSTYDQDNDKNLGNCASDVMFKGGWWFNNCWSGREAMLNGHYMPRNYDNQGIIYRSFGKTSLKKSTMKIRKV